MIDKQEQMNKLWEVNNAFGRVWSKVLKKHKSEHIETMYNERENEKNAQMNRKKDEIEAAWIEHENAEKSAKARTEKLTAKQIQDFMQEQNS